MSKPCRVCVSPLKYVVESSLVLREPVPSIAKKTSLSEDSIHRHKRHMNAGDPTNPEVLIDLWLTRINDLYVQAHTSGDRRTSLEASKTSLSLLGEKTKLQEMRRERDREKAEQQPELINKFDAMIAKVDEHDRYWKAQGLCPICHQALPAEEQKTTPSVM